MRARRWRMGAACHHHLILLASALQTASPNLAGPWPTAFSTAFVIHRALSFACENHGQSRALTIGRPTESPVVLVDLTLGSRVRLALLVRNRRIRGRKNLPRGGAVTNSKQPQAVTYHMASTVPPCGRGSVQPLWDSTKGRYVEVECPHTSRVEFT